MEGSEVSLTPCPCLTIITTTTCFDKLFIASTTFHSCYFCSPVDLITLFPYINGSGIQISLTITTVIILAATIKTIATGNWDACSVLTGLRIFGM
jgi:hypothetical protein